MRPDDVVEARRQLDVCNACRYCEGLCAVFPAIERRTSFDDRDVGYLAHLCHDCGACVAACMYAPPHEFAIDIRTLLADVRTQTMRGSAGPAAAAAALDIGPARFVVATTVLAAAGIAAAALGGSLAPGHGSGSFYRVVPYPAMFGAGLALGGAALVAGWLAVRRFARAIAAAPDRSRRTALPRALADALTLRYQAGGGAGCPDDGGRKTRTRRVSHHALAGGFLLSFAATAAAAVEQDLLDRRPPFPLASAPVLLGLAGGVAMLLGAAGLVSLRRRPGARAVDPSRRDDALLAALAVVAATGLALLALRDTAAMGPMLIVHLASVTVLFATAPYGKLLHGPYRMSALVRHAVETADEGGPRRDDDRSDGRRAGT
jgi:citrate/tricarballylate utilization protein